MTASIEEPRKRILPEVISPELQAFIDTDQKFRDDYFKRTGVHWLSEIDRPPPRWHMWEAKEVGQKHTVTTNETLFERLPSKDAKAHDDEAKQCRVAEDEVTFELEVLSTHPKVFKIKVRLDCTALSQDDPAQPRR